MRRNTLNYAVDTTILVLALPLLASGLILAFVLLPGSGGHGRGEASTLWGLGRHDWGDVHFWIATGLCGLALLHLALHWSWVWNTTRGVFGLEPGPPSGATRRNTVGVVLALAVVGAFAAFVGVARSTVQVGGGQRLATDTGDGKQHEPVPELAGLSALRGSSTLGEAADAAGLTIEALIQHVGLPPDSTRDDRLGPLCRAAGLRMSDLRAALTDGTAALAHDARGTERRQP